ncbi:hypothetical protein AGMMS50212_12380 [Spirochaetia bacterium]|nr:hypothetical protein AGMMS50212_12380 [Spirochaetia bacterium]
MGKIVFCIIPLIVFMGCASSEKVNTNHGQRDASQSVPDWVRDMEKVYPSTDWVTVMGQAAEQKEAENIAINALSRAFKTDISSLTEANQQFAQIVDDVAGKRSLTFNESKDFSINVKTGSSVKALIGMEISTFQSADRSTWYVNARMNRRESASRYAGMVRENVTVINRLLSRATALESRSGLEAFAALYYAVSIAQVTDNFQNILEVLDPSAVNRRPAYGGATTIKTRILSVAGRITIGLRVETEDRQESVTIRRALGALFTGMGFKANEQGKGDYTLTATVTFETVDTTQTKTCRWFLDAVLEARDGKALFSYTGQDRATHLQDKEARRLALRSVESSIKERDFAVHFVAWLGSLME